MNKAILMGRLTRDPEQRFSNKDNLEISKFALAVNRGFKKQGEESATDFINIVAFGKLAETCNKYLKKGQQVLVGGRIQVSTYDGQDGKKQYWTDVVIDEMHFTGSKSDDNSSEYKPSTNVPNTNTNNDNGFSINEDDDELPF